MEKGSVENGFIVDLSHASKMSEVIYELSAILEIAQAKDKDVLLKVGDFEMNPTQLSSVKAMVESMGANLSQISATSKVTRKSADELGIELTELENVVPTLDFENKPEVNRELKVALDKIFGAESSNISDIRENMSESAKNTVQALDSEEPTDDFSDAAAHDEINKVIENANKIHPEIDIDDIAPEIQDRVMDDELTEEEKALLKETEQLPTLYIQRTLRSGQSVKSEGNIVIIGDVNPGSEIIAKGDITVWGILGGIAHAGCDGNSWAKVRALKMNPIQLRIADVLSRRPDAANIPYIQKTDTFVPEEAVMRRKQIYIHKLYEN